MRQIVPTSFWVRWLVAMAIGLSIIAALGYLFGGE
jgi:hypothetical protein